MRAGSSPTPAGAGEVLRAGPQHRGRCWKSKREKASGEARSAGPALPARGPSWGPVGRRGWGRLQPAARAAVTASSCTGRRGAGRHPARGHRARPHRARPSPAARRRLRGGRGSPGPSWVPRAIVACSSPSGGLPLSQPKAPQQRGRRAPSRASHPPRDPLRPPPRPHALPGCGARRSGAPYLS